MHSVYGSFQECKSKYDADAAPADAPRDKPEVDAEVATWSKATLKNTRNFFLMQAFAPGAAKRGGAIFNNKTQEFGVCKCLHGASQRIIGTGPQCKGVLSSQMCPVVMDESPNAIIVDGEARAREILDALAAADTPACGRAPLAGSGHHGALQRRRHGRVAAQQQHVLQDAECTGAVGLRHVA